MWSQKVVDLGLRVRHFTRGRIVSGKLGAPPEGDRTCCVLGEAPDVSSEDSAGAKVNTTGQLYLMMFPRGCSGGVAPVATRPCFTVSVFSNLRKRQRTVHVAWNMT